MNYKKIVQAICDELGGQTHAAEEIGVSQPTVHAWLNGSVIKSDNLIKIMAAAERLGVVVDAPSARTKNRSFIEVEEIDIRFGAGAGGLESQLINRADGNTIIRADAIRDERWGLPAAFLQSGLRVNPKSAVIAEVSGDSGYNPSDPNAPGSLMPGDRVIIDTSDIIPSPPGAFALWDGGGLVIKMVEVIYGSDPVRYALASRNPGYRVYEILQDEARIIGRVKGRITSM